MKLVLFIRTVIGSPHKLYSITDSILICLSIISFHSFKWIASKNSYFLFWKAFWFCYSIWSKCLKITTSRPNEGKGSSILRRQCLSAKKHKKRGRVGAKNIEAYLMQGVLFSSKVRLFFESAYGQIWPFKLFWTWQPWLDVT